VGKDIVPVVQLGHKGRTINATPLTAAAAFWHPIESALAKSDRCMNVRSAQRRYVGLLEKRNKFIKARIAEAKEHIEGNRFEEYMEKVLLRKDLACGLEGACRSWAGIKGTAMAPGMRAEAGKLKAAGFGSAAELMEDAASLAEMHEKEKSKARVKAAFRLVSASDFMVIADELDKDGEPEKCKAANLLRRADSAIQKRMPRCALALLEGASEFLGECAPLK